LTVGLPGVGKTTLARRLARENRAVRLTPDEWMIPLFGEPEGAGRRDVLEGLLLGTAHQVLRAGASVVLDFGCWAANERWAIRAVGEHADAEFKLHFIDMPEDERRIRTTRRTDTAPASEFELSSEDHDRFLSLFQRPSKAELDAVGAPLPPEGSSSWLAWAANRWPGLPDLATEQ
jgi:predicted kinase